MEMPFARYWNARLAWYPGARRVDRGIYLCVGRHIFSAPDALRACKATTIKNLIDPGENNARLIVKKSHLGWGRQGVGKQARRILTDADGVGTDMLNVVDSVARECDVCMAFENTPHFLVAGASLASASNEKVRMDFLVLGNLVTLRAMDLLSRNSTLVMVSPKNPFGVWDGFAGSWITGLGKLRCRRMDSGG